MLCSILSFSYMRGFLVGVQFSRLWSCLVCQKGHWLAWHPSLRFARLFICKEKAGNLSCMHQLHSAVPLIFVFVYVRGDWRFSPRLNHKMFRATGEEAFLNGHILLPLSIHFYVSHLLSISRRALGMSNFPSWLLDTSYLVNSGAWAKREAPSVNSTESNDK